MEKSIKIPEKEAKEIIAKYNEPDHIDVKTFIDLFGRKYDSDKQKVLEPKYKTYDIFIIPKGMYMNNTKPIVTTIGKYIVNVYMFKSLHHIFGYYNEYLSKKGYSKMDEIWSRQLCEGNVTPEEIIKFKNREQSLFAITYMLTPSLSRKIYGPDKKVLNRKSELLKKNAKKLEDGDVRTAVEMEEELLNLAREELQSDHGFELFNSGAIGSFENNYKCLNVMKGPVMDVIEGKFKICTNSFSEGMNKKDMPLLANGAVESLYGKGVGTRIAGYNTKKNIASFQGIVLDDDGTDCGTKLTMDFKLDEESKKLVYMCYFVDKKGKLRKLDEEQMKLNMNTVIKLRLPHLCKGEKICSICGGNLFYILGIKSIGTTTVNESASHLNKFMKKMHDTSVKIHKLDLDTIVME